MDAIGSNDKITLDLSTVCQCERWLLRITANNPVPKMNLDRKTWAFDRGRLEFESFVEVDSVT